jgi:hypothetical protein
MKKKYFVFLFVVLLFFSGCDATGEDVVAEPEKAVDEEPEEELLPKYPEGTVIVIGKDRFISQEEIESHFRFLEMRNEDDATEEIWEKAMDAAIYQEVKRIYFEEEGIYATDKEVEEMAQVFVTQISQVENVEELYQFFLENNFTEEEVERQLRDEVKMEKIAHKFLEEGRIEISEEEMDKSYLFTGGEEEETRDFVYQHLVSEKAKAIVEESIQEKIENLEILYIEN